MKTKRNRNVIRNNNNNNDNSSSNNNNTDNYSDEIDGKNSTMIAVADTKGEVIHDVIIIIIIIVTIMEINQKINSHHTAIH